MYEKVVRKVGYCFAVIACIATFLIPRSLALEPRVERVDYTCMAAAIYHEARGEPAKARRAVAEVVANRAFKSGKNFCEVVAQKQQFSWYKKHGVKPLNEDLTKLLDSTYNEAQVLRNRNFLYFYSGAPPKWSHSMVCIPIGRLNFCKEKHG